MVDQSDDTFANTAPKHDDLNKNLCNVAFPPCFSTLH